MRKFLVALVCIPLLAACGTSHGGSDEKKIPATFIGDWQQTSGDPGAVMIATITPGAIQIDMRTRETTHVYWIGTFDTNKSTSDSFSTISLGDQEIMSNMLFASTDPVKKFTYKDGDLSYKFSIMGSTTTVHLSHKDKA